MVVAKELRQYKVYPKVVRANRRSRITIVSYDEKKGFQDGTVYNIRHYQVDKLEKPQSNTDGEDIQVTAQNGEIVFDMFFYGEQEHYLYITKAEGNWPRRKFCVYSVNDDLYERRPYKGDLHIHSNNSDGMDHACEVASYCRREGYDFMALTDHGKMYPSVEVQDFYKDADIDISLFNGEEIHPEGNFVHIVNFGGDVSINEYMVKYPEEYKKEVEAIKEGITDELTDRMKWICASCIWCFNKIRETNGLGIFCHPYWYVEQGNHNVNEVNEYMYEHKPYDAEELMGGFAKDQVFSNYFEVSRFFESYWTGKKCGIVGVSDGHGCERDMYFGWYYTIVFAKDTSRESLISAIKDRYSVASEKLQGESQRIYGEMRFVRYAEFLEREVFLVHDELCKQEGNLMLRYWQKDKRAKELLSLSKGQTEEYMEEVFHSEDI